MRGFQDRVNESAGTRPPRTARRRSANGLPAGAAFEKSTPAGKRIQLSVFGLEIPATPLKVAIHHAHAKSPPASRLFRWHRVI